MRRALRALVVGASMMVSLGLAHGQQSANGMLLAFHIEAQPMEAALTEFGTTTGLQVLFKTQLTREQTAPAVVGEFTPEAALKKLLSGTSLRYEWINHRTVAIRGAEAERVGLKRTSYNIDSEQDIRLAEAEDPSRHAPTIGPRDETGEGRDKKIEQVVVTGTHIHGLENKSAPLISIDRSAIERSGYASTQQLMQSIPQTFSGGQNGPSETGVYGTGSSAALNISSASGINLRGLGTTSTLVLLDGHRMAPSAIGTAVDVSLIPLSAIDHVDVMTDGASAIYGADAVAGVVNFSLRKDFDGFESGARYGISTENSPSETVFSQVMGHNWGTGNALLSAQYHKREDLSVSDRSFSAKAAQPNDLLPSTIDKSLVLNVRQDVARNVDTFLQGIYTHKSSDRAFTGTTTSYDLSARADDLNIVAGVRYEPAGDWHWGFSGSLSRENDDTDAMYRRGAPPGYTSGQPYNTNDFKTAGVEFSGDGGLFRIPGGDVRVALGGAYRKEDAEFRVVFRSSTQRYDRSVKAAFAEVYIPVFGTENAARLARSLTLSAAARYDNYSDFGGSTNPRFGISWSPIDSINLRATYSTSFRAPAANEEFLAEGSGVNILNFRFASPSGGTVPVFILTGSRPSLEPERAHSFTTGLDYLARNIEGLRFSLDYYHIDFRNRIVKPPFDVSALLHPEIYGSLLTPLANDSEAQAFLQSQLANGARFVNVLGSGATGIRTAYDTRQQNAARLRQEGFDTQVQYAFNVGRSRMDATFNAALIRDILTSFSVDSAPANTVNTYGNPLKRRIRAAVTWSLDEISVSSSVDYAGKYRDTTVLPQAEIGSWTRVNLFASYSPSAVKGLSAEVGVQNLFNAQPPTAGSVFPGVFLDVANADPLGRFAWMQLRKRW